MLELTAGRPGGSLASVTLVGVVRVRVRVRVTLPNPNPNPNQVTLVGVGRCEVLGLEAGRGRVVTVRVRPFRDEAPRDASERDEAAALCARVSALWAEVSERHRALQDIKLQAKLRRLGGSASAALLAIPTEQLLDLRATSEAKGGAPRQTPEARRPSVAGLEASLAAGLDLDDLVSQVLLLGAASGAVRSGEPGATLAMAPPPSRPATTTGAAAPAAALAAAQPEEDAAAGAGAAADAPHSAAESAAAAAAYASALSLVALRLSSAADAEEEGEDLSHAASRWARARARALGSRRRLGLGVAVEGSNSQSPTYTPAPTLHPRPSHTPYAHRLRVGGASLGCGS